VTTAKYCEPPIKPLRAYLATPMARFPKPFRLPVQSRMEKKSEECRQHGSEIYWTKPAAE